MSTDRQWNEFTSEPFQRLLVLNRIKHKQSAPYYYVDSNNWILAMRREFHSLVKNNTFEWQKAPRNKNIGSSRLFFTIKSKSDGSHEYKACFIDKGYSQIYGKDYRETFAPTTNMASIRLLLQIAVKYDLLIHHMDVKSAYLNAPLDYEIYIEPTKGSKGKNGNYVWKLQKILSLSIFGLLSLSLLLFPQHFGQYVLRPSSGVYRTQEPWRNFELHPLLNPRGHLFCYLLAITRYKC